MIKKIYRKGKNGIKKTIQFFLIKISKLHKSDSYFSACFFGALAKLHITPLMRSFCFFLKNKFVTEQEEWGGEILLTEENFTRETREIYSRLVRLVENEQKKGE